jgi:two-component system response regulator YesN
MENPSLEDTAHAVNVSASYLSKLFTQNITSTYSQFLTREKINHASKLLSHTNLSITEISGQSGFQNSNYFSDAFKKVTGKSPLKFRKQLHSE